MDISSQAIVFYIFFSFVDRHWMWKKKTHLDAIFNGWETKRANRNNFLHLIASCAKQSALKIDFAWSIELKFIWYWKKVKIFWCIPSSWVIIESSLLQNIALLSQLMLHYDLNLHKLIHHHLISVSFFHVANEMVEKLSLRNRREFGADSFVIIQQLVLAIGTFTVKGFGLFGWFFETLKWQNKRWHHIVHRAETYLCDFTSKQLCELWS